MRRIVLVGLAWLVAGCAADPEDGPLPPGSEAMTTGRPSAGDDHTRLTYVHTAGGFVGLPDGTRVRVVDDGPGRGERRTRVNVLEGEDRGKSGTVPRYCLRPLR